MLLKKIIKNVGRVIILINILIISNLNLNNINDNLLKINGYSNYSSVENISNIPKIIVNVEGINYSYSRQFGLIEVQYFINLFNGSFHPIKPSQMSSIYGLSLLCNIYITETNQNIYSISNILENRFFLCKEYINIGDKVNFGIKIYKINSTSEEIEYYQHFYFTHEFFNINQNPTLENNNKFNMNYLYKSFNELLNKIKKYKSNSNYLKKAYNLKSSFLQPPFFSLKRDIAQVEGKWYFNNLYETYFCFCNGDSCINVITFNMYNFQSCKYFFYLTIIDSNRNLYPKTDYLLSDFFDENIESSDALPLFKEMINKNLKAHYLTVSPQIYRQFCFNNVQCLTEQQMIYGIKKINGNILEKFLLLFLRLKAVIAAEKYYSIDNLFYNIDYITFIFLGHGVTYIKSFLYENYLSPKMYNKILLPPCKKFIKLALDAGWKNENIIKIGYPRWDNYDLFTNSLRKGAKSIFLMFTWRKLKKDKNLSKDYFNNLFLLLNDTHLNNQLKINNIKLFFCFHHTLKEKEMIKFNGDNIHIIEQNIISTLLKNSSLIITDFSSILFDAIVQRKPLILFIPDGLDPNLEDIYVNEYYEIINKIRNGTIYLYEVFFHLNKAINKIIYYIKNDFILENEKLEFYKKFRLKNSKNTKKLIKYLNHLK